MKQRRLYLSLVLIWVFLFSMIHACFASTKTIYIFANGERIARIEGSTVHYFLNDQVKSTSLRVDEMGNVKGRFEYLPFGGNLIGNGSIGDYRFTGKELDQSTGLYYFGARYYEPGVGRFVSIDPRAGNSPAISPYGYPFNNPLRYIDPTGLEGEDAQEPQEITREELLERIRSAQESEGDALSIVIGEIESAGDVRVSGETLLSTMQEYGVELPEKQKSELGKVESIIKRDSELKLTSSGKIKLETEGASLKLDKEVTARISVNSSRISLSKIEGVSAKSKLFGGGVKKATIFKGEDGRAYVEVKVKVFFKTITRTIPLEEESSE